MARAQSAGWVLENIRVSAFGGQNRIEFPDFKAVLKTKPTQEVRTPNEQFATAPFGAGQFLLGAQPQTHRQDFIYAPKLPEGSDARVLANIGQWPPRDHTKFQAGIARWLESGPKVQRLAVGLVFLRSVSSPTEGMSLVRKHLPFIPGDMAEGDFLIQFNRPFDLKSPKIKVNRLQKWSVAPILILTLATGPATVLDQSQKQDAVRLEVDVNTPAEYPKPLPSNHIITIFESLWDEAGKLVPKDK